MMTISLKRKRREAGNSIVEVALLSPWIFFLFVGIFDMGFYTYAAICTENAARAAATQTAASASAGLQSNLTACDGAWDELKGLPNVAGITKDCTQLPVIVTQKTLCGSAVDTSVITTCASPRVDCADCGQDTKAASSQVAVQYQSIPLVPIPGLLTGRLTITRSVEMRIIAE